MFKTILVKDGRLLKDAQRLRKKVFFAQEGQDEDSFDKICQHLLVLNRKSQEAVGTYRLLLGSVAKKSLGFYSEQEFDLSKIKKNCKGELLELGRACVRKDYRKNRIINLLWKEIIRYMLRHKVKYVFGCASINNPTPKKIGKIYYLFKKRYFAPSKFQVKPLKEKRYPYLKNHQNFNEDKVFRLLPSLVRGYLKMGAYVCSEPVWDKEFNTADFFMLLDVERMNEKFKTRFYASNS